MDMKAKSSVIRQLRTDRLWSQEHLAKAAGLGLRTIQRLESRGSCSPDTIKAIAAVFEVESSSLVWPDGEFQLYRHRQWGVLTIAVVVAAAVLVVELSNHLNALPPSALGIVLGFLTIVCFVFSSMTIEVNESEIAWHFGPGIFRKRISLEEVGSCVKVKNPFWMGWGIHPFGTGWIYNISGLWGVEIELKGGSLVRLGTDEPNYLCQAIVDAKGNVGID